MDWNKLIFTVAVAGIGAFAVYKGDAAIAGTCLGIMGAILRPGQNESPNSDVSSTTTVTPKGVTPNEKADFGNTVL
jgi:hypothetical protein